jgi:hypothetical protein
MGVPPFTLLRGKGCVLLPTSPSQLPLPRSRPGPREPTPVARKAPARGFKVELRRRGVQRTRAAAAAGAAVAPTAVQASP